MLDSILLVLHQGNSMKYIPQALSSTLAALEKLYIAPCLQVTKLLSLLDLSVTK